MTEKRPFDVLNSAVNNTVLVRLTNGVEIRGDLVSYDVHMNLVLENATELQNGEEKRKLGTMLIRGGIVTFISPSSA